MPAVAATVIDPDLIEFASGLQAGDEVLATGELRLIHPSRILGIPLEAHFAAVELLVTHLAPAPARSHLH